MWNEYRRVMRGHVLVQPVGTRRERARLDGVARRRPDLALPVGHAHDLRIRMAFGRVAARARDHARSRQPADPGAARVLPRAPAPDRGRVTPNAADESMSRYDEAISRFERAARLTRRDGAIPVRRASPRIYAYGKRDPDHSPRRSRARATLTIPSASARPRCSATPTRSCAPKRRWAGSTDAFDADQQYRQPRAGSRRLRSRPRSVRARAVLSRRLAPPPLAAPADRRDRTGDCAGSPARRVRAGASSRRRGLLEPPLKTPPVSVESP